MTRNLIVLIILYVTVSSKAQTLESINKLFELYKGNNYNGAILIAKENEILAKKAFGISDQETKKENTVATLFRTESTGKFITAISVMQLVEKGRIDLEGTIKDYLPSSKIKNADKITIHHLLTHQSGLTSPWERPDFEWKKYTREEWLEIIESNPLVFDEPGKGVYYSSSGYEILALIVESISHRSFYDYCKRNIFDIAKMDHTFNYLTDDLYSKKGAKPYRWIGKNTYYEYPLDDFEASGAGGWISTLNDFYNLSLAFLEEKLVSKKYMDIMMQNHVEFSTEDDYGYGLEITTLPTGEVVFGHNGGGKGFGADILFEPKTKTIVITMLNMYGNSRFVTHNFMQVALGNPAVPITKNQKIELFELIKAKGIEDFSENHQKYFEEIGIKEISPYFLLTFADGLKMLNDKLLFRDYLISLKRIIPNSLHLFIYLGDLEIESNNSSLAKEYYLKAKKLSEKNDRYWLSEIDQKLNKLN